MFTLIIEDKNGAIADEFSFESGSFTIGRSTSCDIVLPSANVSRQHARLFVEGGQCFVEDVESVNGIVVDGRRVRGKVELGPASQIKVGDFYLHVERSRKAQAIEDGTVRARLHGKNLAVAGRTYALTRPVNLIGRGRDASTTIIDSSVSRVHAKITAHEDGSLTVEDLRSANGTFINGEPIDKAPLEHGDRVRFGNVEFEVDKPGATATLYGVTAPSMSAPPRGMQAADRSLAPPDVEQVDPTALMTAVADDANRRSIHAPRRRWGGWLALAAAGAGIGAVAVYFLWRVPMPDRLPAPLVQSASPALPAQPSASSEGVGVSASHPGDPEPRLAGAPPVESTRAAHTAAGGGEPAAGGRAAASATPPPPDPRTLPARPAGLSDDDAQTLASRGESLIAEAKWKDAAAVYGELKEARPLQPDYQRAYNLAVLEGANEESLRRGRQLVTARLWTEALKAFNAVTPDSRYRIDATREIQAISEQKQALTAQGDALCAKRKWLDCHGFYVDALAIDPNDLELQRKVGEVKVQLAKQEKKKRR